MGRSWQEVKQDKRALDGSRGRDVEAAEARAQAATNAYILSWIAQLPADESRRNTTHNGFRVSGSGWRD